MKRRFLTLIAATTLAATGVACGGDDGGGAGSGPQAELASQILADAADDDDFPVDEACVRRVTAGLSDDDARALLADDDEALSVEGGMKLFELFECIDLDLGDLDFDELLED